jgi:hypothetical protein
MTKNHYKAELVLIVLFIQMDGKNEFTRENAHINGIESF